MMKAIKAKNIVSFLLIVALCMIMVCGCSGTISSGEESVQKTQEEIEHDKAIEYIKKSKEVMADKLTEESMISIEEDLVCYYVKLFDPPEDLTYNQFEKNKYVLMEDVSAIVCFYIADDDSAIVHWDASGKNRFGVYPTTNDLLDETNSAINDITKSGTEATPEIVEMLTKDIVARYKVICPPRADMADWIKIGSGEVE